MRRSRSCWRHVLPLFLRCSWPVSVPVLEASTLVDTRRSCCGSLQAVACAHQLLGYTLQRHTSARDAVQCSSAAAPALHVSSMQQPHNPLKPSALSLCVAARQEQEEDLAAAQAEYAELATVHAECAELKRQLAASQAKAQHLSSQPAAPLTPTDQELQQKLDSMTRLQVLPTQLAWSAQRCTNTLVL